MTRISLRRATAAAAGKAAGGASRLLGKGGGTALPGLVALAVDPGLIAELAFQIGEGSVVISGTNGKTTTSRILASVAGKAGMSTVRNHSGSNLMRGLATSLMDETDVTGNLRQNGRMLGLFEVDEAALPKVLGALTPRSVLLLDLFRDQLDRYGEVAAVARLWESAVSQLHPATRLVANADDPLVTDVASKAAEEPIYFGIASTDRSDQSRQHASDVKACPRCAGQIRYSSNFLGHLGHYACTACGFTRPEPAVRAENVRLRGMEGCTFRLIANSEEETITYPLPGLYNVYNALGAAAVATALGIRMQTIVDALESATPAFGRMERLEIGGRKVILALAKNPTGLNEVIRTLPSEGPLNVLVMLNDNIADGRDVSWIWDADVEMLHDRVRSVVFSGTRAEDIALRFKYADIPADSQEPSFDIVSEPSNALDRALERTPPGQFLFIVATYTAMLDIRRELATRGYVKPYWQG